MKDLCPPIEAIFQPECDLEVWQREVGLLIPDWRSRASGAQRQLEAVMRNLHTIGVIRQMGDLLQSRLNKRTNHAGLVLLQAADATGAALLLHMAEPAQRDFMTLVALRSSLDFAGTAAHIATGSKREATHWEGEKQFTSKERNSALARILAEERPGCPAPDKVYSWLCDFTHCNAKAVSLLHRDAKHQLTHEMAYAALAYVAWICAVLTERISGCDNLATWPDMPDELPWDRNENGAIAP